MKILLPIDESRSSEAAVASVIAQFQPQGNEVRVVHVVEPPPLLLSREMGGYEPRLEEMLQRQLQEAETLVRKTAEALERKGFTVTTNVEQGEPRSRILDIASEWQADIIVLGCHGRKGLERFLMGSVSEGVAHHAPCSVQIVRGRPAK
jgi:nucleotide-binding universal stress UspA family protein